MDLEKVTARIRPRRGWEAIDLGVSLVQQHARFLYQLWFIISLPFYILLSVGFFSSPIWTLVCFWWLKPILERPLLHFISRVLFGESLSMKQCLKDFWPVAKIQLIASLTWRRFSFTRSLDLPLIQLEGLQSIKRANRLKILHSGDSGSAVWLTIIFFLVELIILMSIVSLIYLFVPAVYLENFEFLQSYSGDSESVIGTHLTIFIYYLGVSLVSPLFVACGFTLYLNQRTHLEAWDIELSFKRLASRLAEKSANLNVRLAGIFAVVSLTMFGGLMGSAELYAQSQDDLQLLQESKASTEVSQQQESVLPQNELEHDQVKNIIKEIKEGEDFHKKEKRESNRYRNTSDDDPLKTESEINSISSGWIIFANLLALIMEFALWIFVAVLLVFLVLRYKHLLGNTISNKKTKQTRPKTLFGLDLDNQSLPDKPWVVARQLVLEEQYRQAVSLLYRASLIWYIENSEVLIKEGNTELECLTQIVKHVSGNSQLYIKNLTHTWRAVAYAHIQPDPLELINLCDDWPGVMGIINSEENHSESFDSVTKSKGPSTGDRQ